MRTMLYAEAVSCLFDFRDACTINVQLLAYISLQAVPDKFCSEKKALLLAKRQRAFHSPEAARLLKHVRSLRPLEALP